VQGMLKRLPEGSADNQLVRDFGGGEHAENDSFGVCGMPIVFGNVGRRIIS
jgi:hypothetical protein